MLGVGLRSADWNPLEHSDEYGDWVLPIFILASEQDPADSTDPMTPAKRADLLELATVAIEQIYKYFRQN